MNLLWSWNKILLFSEGILETLQDVSVMQCGIHGLIVQFFIHITKIHVIARINEGTEKFLFAKVLETGLVNAFEKTDNFLDKNFVLPFVKFPVKIE